MVINCYFLNNHVFSQTLIMIMIIYRGKMISNIKNVSKQKKGDKRVI